MTTEQDVTAYLERVERAEKEQSRRWWKRMVPIDTADMRTAIVERWQNVQSGELDAKRIRAHKTAQQRVSRNLPHCLYTFNLICRYGNNRKESICQLAKIMRRNGSTSATGRK